MHEMNMPVAYHMWAQCRKAITYMLKLTKISKLKDLLTIRNDLQQEFIDKAIVSFRNRLQSHVAADGGLSELAADIHQ